MAGKRHKWEYEDFEKNIDKCSNCGITRHRTITTDGIMKKRGQWFMEYKIDGVMVDKSPECKKQETEG